MRYRGSSKIKYEHGMINGLRKALEEIESWPEIISIIPAVIKPTKRSQSFKIVAKNDTSSGIKCIAYSGCAVQELFIICNDCERLREKLIKRFDWSFFKAKKGEVKCYNIK